ncbi:MAG: glycoside hydrolase domain-containing protein, partial [Flavisolibacter sp.]
NSWQYSFAVPQDIGTLIDLHGGKESFASKLNELFTTTSQTTGRDQADVTGLIGQYAQGNEPSHHMAYLFNYVGMPWRTQEIVHSICTEFYKNDPNGLIGNEDCGQMSAWYILSSMGFYPVCPGTGEYVLGTPLFNEVKIKLENGKQFLIRAKRNSANAKYVTGTSLNGKPLTRSYLSHPDIMNGGVFEFTLSGTPGKNWGTSSADLPHSKINAGEIVPVPFFDISTNKFRDSMLVSIKSTDSAAKYEYAVFANSDSGFETGRRRTYSGPFFIDSSQSISAFAIKNGRGSFVVGQVFYKVPSDKSITVLTKVNPMYTGGGPDALIDGIMGNKRWQTGEWQSYYGQDFEAIIDLKQSKAVSYVGIHVLQDPGPWILYPKELIIYTSSDGKDFNEVGRMHNTSDQKIETIETKEMGEKISLQTRYIKVKALNAGKLPAWHESAGNPSHLFIDEVIVR